ncbi:hypothetical protein [Brevundimonas sp.]|uniref:hypothetical protein n=1 Tax=Brevundimonas sp. TaxID=1871086 RepID=UPI003918B162
MKIVTLSFVAALAAGVGSVSATERLSDAEYLALGRCAGLAAGLDQNADNWRAAFRAGAHGRSTMARDEGDRHHDEARRSARRSDEVRRRQLAAELQGRCAAFAPTPS